jgi:Purple acid Phosphatase, N-terminal domain
MNRRHKGLAMMAAAVSLLFSHSILAQMSLPRVPSELPPAAKAPRVHITQGPELESAVDSSAIISWTSNNPGGADEHYGVVHYGTNPRELSQTAKSHIRLNRQHSYTVFRVFVDGLAPRTTYYYTVDSMEPNGRSDGVKSAVRKFTTPGSGERISAQTQMKMGTTSAP